MSLEALIELHEGLDRLGPGDEACTRRALALCRPLPPRPAVADLGCGTGASTLVLARELGSHVLGLDLHPGFLETLDTRARASGLEVGTRCADMADPGLEPASLDLLWSEGAVYLLGFEAGLRAWAPLVKPGGFLALTDAAWLVPDPPREALEAWERWYPAMDRAETNLARARALGLEVVDAFPLPESAWWAYYRPLWARCETRRHEPRLRDVVQETRKEMQLLERCPGAYGYVFHVLRVPR